MELDDWGDRFLFHFTVRSLINKHILLPGGTKYTLSTIIPVLHKWCFSGISTLGFTRALLLLLMMATETSCGSDTAASAPPKVYVFSVTQLECVRGLHVALQYC